MIVLDTDHITVLRYTENPRCALLQGRLEASGEPSVTTVVTWEEQLRGWLAEINRCRSFEDQIVAYERLRRLAEFINDWELLAFDAEAAAQCELWRKQRVRIGAQDLKIAAIVFVNDALLLSGNLRDFQRLPGLRVESWLD